MSDPKVTSPLGAALLATVKRHVTEKNCEDCRSYLEALAAELERVARSYVASEPAIETACIAISDIKVRVASHYKIRNADMTSDRRSRDVARPRQVAMYLSKVLTTRTLSEIGRLFGDRDHTTVMHAVRNIEGLRSRSPAFDREIRSLQEALVHGQ
jgi:chromosomal replication initiation ATPase DnaA